jgi:hypothetical protein
LASRAQRARNVVNRLFFKYLVEISVGIIGPMNVLPQPLRDETFLDPADLAAMADALGRSADYGVLRRLVARPTYTPANGQQVKWRPARHRNHRPRSPQGGVIELGMVKSQSLLRPCK